MVRKLFVGIAALCLIGLGFFLALSWEQAQQKKAKKGPQAAGGSGRPGAAPSQPARTPTVEVAQLIQRDLRARVVGNGIIRPIREVDVVARVEGMVEEIGVEAGDDVTTETTLCRIDEQALLLAVTTATIESKEAEKALEAMTQLQKRSAASQQEYEAALFRSQRSQAALDEANLLHSYATPPGPFEGVVTQRHIEVGQHVRAGDLLFSVADFTPLQMRLFLAEKDVLAVAVGQDVELRRNEKGELLSVGKVERISRVVDRESLTVEVTLQFDYDGDAVGLRPGSFARVDIVTQRYPKSLVVPRGAVRTDEKGAPFVFRVLRDAPADGEIEVGSMARLEKIPVNLSFNDDRIYRIETRRDPQGGYDDSRPPLTAGDRIVVEGSKQLRSGATVKIYRELDIEVDPAHSGSDGITTLKRWLEAVIRRPVSVGMLTLASVVFGWVSFGKLPIELLPDISYPSLTIQTELPDAAPEEVEKLVTDRIEERVAVVGGMKRYHSVSRAGSSEITLEFGWNVDMTVAALDVREKLDLVELPDQARLPIVFRFDPSLDPVLRIALTGPFPIVDLRRLSEDVVKERLEVLDGVAAAKVVGGAEEEVRVLLDEARITQLGLTVQYVAQKLAEENVNTSGGELRDAQTAYLLRTIKEFESLQDIEQTILLREAGREIRVEDVGRVELGFRDEEIRVRVDGTPAVELHVYKEGDANSVDVARGVRAELLKFAQDRRLSDVQSTVLFDQARYIEESVDNVQSTALLGGLLAAAILFLFLRDLLSTLVIAVSIPISVAVTFFLMQLSGVTLNVMSLGGLALGIGMLVDNSVVVLEAIRRRRERKAEEPESSAGEPPGGSDVDSSVVEGSREVIGGVIASTLTTVSVFLPLVFVEGVAGQLFGDQALVVTFSLLASLVVSMTVIPCLLGNRWGDPDHLFSRISRGLQLPLTPVLAIFERGLRFVTQTYAKLLRSSLRASWAAPVIALVLFVTVTPQARQLGTELVPDLFQGEFYFEVELAEGTPIDVTDDRTQLLERAIQAEVKDGDWPVERVFVSVGGTQVLGDVQAGDQLEHVARINVSLKAGTSSEVEAQVVSALEQAMLTVPNVQPHLGRPSLFTFRDPIEVEVYAEELEVLRESAMTIAERMRGIPGIWDVDSGVAERSPEFHVALDPIRLADRNLSQGQVAAELASKALGSVLTQYTAAPKPIDIRVMADGIRRGKREDFARLSVLPEGLSGDASDGVSRPLLLTALGDLEEGLGPVEVKHLNGERAAQITARVEGRDLGSVSADVDQLLSSRLLPPNASAKLSGQNEEMAESLNSLLFALALAVFLVYLVLASSFESLRLPFVIILTVPLGLIGAVVALWIASSAVGVLAMIGLIMLSGIVVNNGIIFIARIQQHAESGLSRVEAAARAGQERLRPILITTSTTVLGLLPLAIGWGAGAELRQPLAITVIGGLLGATLLALFVVPSGYLLLTPRSESDAPSASSPPAGSSATEPSETEPSESSRGRTEEDDA